MKTGLIIFGRYPKEGQAKTRLARTGLTRSTLNLFMEYNINHD